MNVMCPTPPEALAIAATVVASRYSEAVFAFAAGSIMRGEGCRLCGTTSIVGYYCPLHDEAHLRFD
jgi:hypothetical protein